MPRKKSREEDEGEDHGQLYGCLRCGKPAYFEKHRVGDRYEPVRLVHVDRDLDKDHAAMPIPRIMGVNVQLNKDGYPVSLQEVEMRECGYCGQAIYRKSPLEDWGHAQWGSRALVFDHVATPDKPSHKECMAYKQKWLAIMEATKDGNIPLVRLIRDVPMAKFREEEEDSRTAFFMGSSIKEDGR